MLAAHNTHSKLTAKNPKTLFLVTMANRDYMPKTMFKIKPLNTDNWLGWKQRVMALFQDRDLDGYVDGTIPRPAQVGTTVDPIIAAEQLA